MTGSPIVDEMTRWLTHGVIAPGQSPMATVEALVRWAGSGRAAARIVGVSESTFRGWRKGVTPRRDLQSFLRPARAAFAADRLADARSGATELKINAVVRVSNDTRQRTLHVGNSIPRRAMREVLRRWAAGDPDAKTEAYLVHLIDTYYTPLAYVKIQGAYFA